MISIFPFVHANSQKAFFESSEHNKIKLYYNLTGDIVPQEYATNFRIAAVNPGSLYFEGEFTDFTISGEKVVTGNYKNSFLNGKASYYYPSGSLKETGNYLNGLRDSTWTFLYPNGQLEKTIIFTQGIPFVKNYFSKSGKLLLDNGTGTYKGEFYKNNGVDEKFTINGKFINGKFEGRWTVPGITTEFFKAGVFQEGVDVIRYTNHQQITLENLLGYYSSEHLMPVQCNFFCTKCVELLGGSQYFNVNGSLNSIIYESFINNLSKLLDSLHISNGGMMIQFDISEDGLVSNENIIALPRLMPREVLIKLLRKTNWQVLECDKKASGIQYMMLLISSGKIYSSESQVVTNNSVANLMLKQMKETNLLICH